jgi:putative FmdB family regulatory protein
MPIYEYECPQGHQHEHLIHWDSPVPPCPQCGALESRRLVSSATPIFKGEGWSRDLYGLSKSKSSGEG